MRLASHAKTRQKRDFTQSLGNIFLLTLLETFARNVFALLCLSQFQLGTSPPGNPRENLFERANPGYPDIFLSNSPAPGQKWWSNSGGRAKFSQTRRNCSLSLQKILKKTTRQYKFFYLESLTKPYTLNWSRTTEKSYLQPWYSIKTMNICIHKCIVLTVVVH